MEIAIAVVYVVLIVAVLVVRRAIKLRNYQDAHNLNARSTVRMQTEFERHP